MIGCRVHVDPDRIEQVGWQKALTILGKTNFLEEENNPEMIQCSKHGEILIQWSVSLSKKVPQERSCS